ncbi:MAG: hypothetical protein KIT18_05515 [Burkholderiales bacterium]|nr:hypothetical protein [Burkholderiales bacterium]
MRHLIAAGVLGVILTGTGASAAAAELIIGASHSIEGVLSVQRTKRVTLRLRSGQEITGTVKNVTGRLVQLGEISGKEFFDAVIPLEAVDAILIRTKE